MNCKEVLAFFQEQYHTITPDEFSISITQDMWQEWSKSGVTPPNINAIAADYAKHENGFFYEIAAIAQKMEGKNFNMHFCQFSLDRYNAYAFSAKDGYIVLADYILFQILFFLCVVLVFDHFGRIESDKERADIKNFMDKIITVNYLKRQRVDFSESDIHLTLMKRDYKMLEAANYLFTCLKAFIIAHELGHHVLGHTTGHINKVFAANGKSVTVPVDERLLNCEWEADAYGYKLFKELLNTNDESVYYAFCMYKFEFAPMLLFDIFQCLDAVQEKERNTKITYTDHPHPVDSIKALINNYGANPDDPLYIGFKKSLLCYLGN
jgi:hypothetical protein